MSIEAYSTARVNASTYLGINKLTFFRMFTILVFGRPFVKRFVLCYPTVVCLSLCLSVRLVYCGQTVGWINTKLGTEVGLGPGHTESDGDPPPPPPKWHSPQFSAHICCGQMLDRSNDSVGWGPSSPAPKRGHSPQFSAHVYCGQTAGWIKMALGMEVGLSPGHSVLDRDPGPPKRDTAPNFRPTSIVAKPLDASRYHLVSWR